MHSTGFRMLGADGLSQSLRRLKSKERQSSRVSCLAATRGENLNRGPRENLGGDQHRRASAPMKGKVLESLRSRAAEAVVINRIE